MDYSTIIYPILNTIQVGIAAYITKQLLPEVVKYVVQKHLLARFAHYTEVASAIWNELDEDKRVGDFVGDKFAQFEKMLRAKFPKISDADVLLLNKNIAGVVNIGKEFVKEVVKEATIAPTVEVIAPSKVITIDGKEYVEKVVAPADNVAK